MRKLFIIAILFSTSICFGQTEEVTKIFLIRHTEKVSDGSMDPALSEEGEARAKKWASVLSSESIDAIYSTKFKRTQFTAKAIADTNDLSSIIDYDPRTFDFEEFLTDVKGKSVVVVGHSNTIPAFVNKLIGENKYEQLEDSNYSSLFIVFYHSKNIVDDILLNIE